MFFANGYFYFFTIVLQLVCVIHCIRKGKQNNWIWIIVFLPIIGCLAYIFTEIFTGRDIQNVQSGVGTIFNPGGKLKKLENNLRFSDTFNNRVALADACLETSQTNRAIELYESSLTGNFTENEYVLSKLVIAYFQAKRYDDVLPPLGGKFINYRSLHVRVRIYCMQQFLGTQATRNWQRENLKQ